MDRMNRIALRIVLSMAWAALCGHSATLVVDTDVRYQTIEGFGGSIAHEMWSLKHYDSTYYNMIVDDLGVSLVRLFLQPDFEPQQGTFNTTTGAAGTLLGICRKLSAAGLHWAAPTVFTPPAWMKDNNSEVNGGSLLPEMYDAFAEYYVRYIRAIEQCGLEICAVSPENEPAWAQWYVSCVYSVKQMHDVVVCLGQRFAAEGMSVRVFSAEDVYTNSWQMYARATVGDAVAGQYTDIAAVHHDAVLPTGAAIASYRRDRALLESYAASAGKAPYGIGFWNSEVHATPIDASAVDPWAEAMDVAQSLQMSLRDAKMSAWLMGSITVEPGNTGSESIMLQQTPGPRYHVCKQFFRYVRPDAAMVDAACDDSTILATAFVHSGDQTMSVVLVNPTEGARTVALSVEGADTPLFTQIRSSRSETCDTVGTVTNSVVLPASSITTLFAEGVATSVHPYCTVHQARRPQRVSRMFDLRGKLLAGTERHSGCTLSPGVNGAAVSVRVRGEGELRCY